MSLKPSEAMIDKLPAMLRRICAAWQEALYSGHGNNKEVAMPYRGLDPWTRGEMGGGDKTACSQAETVLAWVKERLTSYKTVGVAINAATPHYVCIEKLDGIYRVYHYYDGSYLMTYINPEKQQIWIPGKP